MQINELPSLGRALQSGDQLAVDDANGITYKVDAGNINPTPTTISIPTSRWSGSGSDYYITVTASNVTADSILIPQYDVASAALLNGPVWCVPAAGSFTIHTSAKPSGTVTILVLFPGTMGEAQYEVLADVYSKSQVDSIVAQSTAITSGNLTAVYSNITAVEIARWVKCGKIASIVCKFTISESSDVTSTQIMFSGAPGANSAYNTAPRFMAMPNDTGSFRKPIRLAVNQNGNIVVWYIYASSIPAGQYEFTFTYIAA